eukprot:2569506-Pleurochrysis_carterae.AAC.2
MDSCSLHGAIRAAFVGEEQLPVRTSSDAPSSLHTSLRAPAGVVRPTDVTACAPARGARRLIETRGGLLKRCSPARRRRRVDTEARWRAPAAPCELPTAHTQAHARRQFEACTEAYKVGCIDDQGRKCLARGMSRIAAIGLVRDEVVKGKQTPRQE